MKRVLVTGGAGFIGSNFIRCLLERYPAVSIFTLDALTYAGSLENLSALPGSDRHKFIHGDICNRELVAEILHEHDIDTIVHFAAESHVDRSIIGPAPFIQTNIVGTFTLLETARQIWIEEGKERNSEVRFHHISTDEVYGSLEPGEPEFTEASPYAPNSPYSASKASSDHLVRAYATTFDLPVTITNCSNNYGPYQFPEKLVPLMILNAQTGNPLPIYGDGQQIRDWLYVDDHCDAIVRVIENGKLGETYNIGGNYQTTNLELVELICSILDVKLPDSPHTPHKNLIRFVADRPGHDRRYAMDISKIVGELGWKPEQTIETGISRTIDWFLSHGDWLEAIMARPSYTDWWEENYSGRGESK